MLLAPFNLTDPSTQRAATPADRNLALMPWLLLWGIAGSILLLLVPALRDNGTSGFSAPFWLVAAPLLNMLWLNRRRGFALLRRRVQRTRHRRMAS